MMDRATLVAAARASIVRGSHSFAAASRLFAPATRERAWLLYCWCRAADDLTDGQEAGHDAAAPGDPLERDAKKWVPVFRKKSRENKESRALCDLTSSHNALAEHRRLVALTTTALDSAASVPLPFAALRQVAAETALPRRWIFAHLGGFALDAQGWSPATSDDLLRYCYHVAGSVGLMMAIIMGVPASDDDTLDRACDLGIAFQLANIARDIVPDAQVGRVYLPAAWLAEVGLAPADLALPAHRGQVAAWAARLVEMAKPYRASARVGAARLPRRSRLAVLAAEAIYGAIGERVAQRGPAAWDTRVSTGSVGKLGLLALAAIRSGRAPPPASRAGLWTAPR